MFDKKVLIISPHQDDEAIGCGGLIQKVLEDKGEVYISHGTHVGDKYQKYNKDSQKYLYYSGETRKQEMLNALDMLTNGQSVEILKPLFSNKYHHKLDMIPICDIVGKIEKIIFEIKPEMIFIPACSWDQDHERLNRACLSIMRPHFYNSTIIEYESIGESNFIPNFYIELSDDILVKKLKSIECYNTQNSGDLHKVSIPSLKLKAEMRGRDIYKKYAEAFCILRMHV